MHRLERPDLGRDRQQHGLGRLEDRQDALVERRPGVDHHHVVAIEQRRQDLRDVGLGDRLPTTSGAAGAASTWSPLSWRIAKVRSSSGSVSADSSRTTSAIVCLGSRLSSVATPPNWKEKSTSTTLSGRFAAAARRHVHGDGRRPDAALRAVDRHRPSSSGKRQAVGRDDRTQVARALEAKEQGLDPGLHLPRVERPGHDVVRAGLEERDALLDFLGRADAHDGDRAHRRRRADLAADLDRPSSDRWRCRGSRAGARRPSATPFPPSANTVTA